MKLYCRFKIRILIFVHTAGTARLQFLLEQQANENSMGFCAPVLLAHNMDLTALLVMYYAVEVGARRTFQIPRRATLPI